MHVKAKVCVVTGAASGIGEAVARAYAAAGARGVVVADLKTSRDRLANVAGDIDGLAVTADVGLEGGHQGADRGGRGQIWTGRRVLFQCRPLPQGTGERLGCRLGRQLAGACHEPRVRGARAGARHARARLRLSAQHRVRRRPAGVAELDALRRDQERGGGARRTSRHSIWRPRHPRFRAVPAIGADRHDDAGPERGAGRRRAAAAGSGADGDRGDGSRTLLDLVAPAGRTNTCSARRPAATAGSTGMRRLRDKIYGAPKSA